MRLYTLLILVFSGLSMQAQVGLSGQYVFASAESDIQYTDANGIMISPPPYRGFQATLDYSQAISSTRIYLVPTFTYGQIDWEKDKNKYLFDQRYQYSTFALYAKIYPFDLEGDCKCPTFHKTGSFLQKGFFIQAGGGYQLMKVTIEGLGGESMSETVGSFLVGGSLGVDIGVSQKITLTPFVELNYTPNTRELKKLNSSPIDLDTKVSLFRVAPGLKLSVHILR